MRGRANRRREENRKNKMARHSRKSCNVSGSTRQTIEDLICEHILSARTRALIGFGTLVYCIVPWPSNEESGAHEKTEWSFLGAADLRDNRISVENAGHNPPNRLSAGRRKPRTLLPHRRREVVRVGVQ